MINSHDYGIDLNTKETMITPRVHDIDRSPIKTAILPYEYGIDLDLKESMRIPHERGINC